ncbi:hypothetical protein C8J56DRAFT_1070168 [Mycena floridula]|nr:hypothetical protein C8J56DRAFT_1070168 [Mycena floridula]
MLRDKIKGRIYDMIEREIGQPLHMGNVRSVKTDPPERYSGAKSIDEFDKWIPKLLNYIALLGLAGPECNTAQIKILGANLTRAASQWFETVICPMVPLGDHVRDWKFNDAIWCLFKHFVRDVTINNSTRDFEDARYNANEGIQTFYYKLVRLGSRMVTPPSNKQIVWKILSSIPPEMRKYITHKKKAVPELLHRKELIRYCQSYEDRLDRDAYWDRQYAKNNPKRSSQSRPEHPRNEAGRYETREHRHDNCRDEWPHEPRRDTRRDHCPRNDRYDHRGPSRRDAPRRDHRDRRDRQNSRDRRPLNKYDTRGNSGHNNRPRSQNKNIAQGKDGKPVKCFSCKGLGHYANDRNCPNYGKWGQAQLRAMQDSAEAGPSNRADMQEGTAAADTEPRGSVHSSGRHGRSSRASSVSSSRSGYNSRESSEYGSAQNLSYYDDLDERLSHSSQSSVSHRAMNVVDDESESDACDSVNIEVSENWGRPIPFFWTGRETEYEIGIHTMQGKMHVALRTAFEIVNDDEVIIRLCEPGFADDDSLGLVQLFYGYDLDLAREMFADFMFTNENIQDCSSIASSEELWCSEHRRKSCVHDALYPEENVDPWGDELMEDNTAAWVQQVLDYGTIRPYQSDSMVSSAKF